MGPIEICIIAVCSAAVAGIIGRAIYRKAKGKSSGCGCGCSSCPHACNNRKSD